MVKIVVKLSLSLLEMELTKAIPANIIRGVNPSHS